MSAKRIECSSHMYNGDKYGGEQESETSSECIEDIEFTFDSSILDCPICFEPLQLPLFQCINGHVACSECSTKLLGKCPVCSTSDTSRCIPFESIIGSYKAKCPYTEFGCAISLSRNEIAAHRNRCCYEPCTCPIPGCNYKCQWNKLSRHINSEHASYEQKKEFDFDQWFSIMVKEQEQPFILQWTTVSVYVLLSHCVEFGYAFWIAHMNFCEKTTYELEVESVDGNSLKLKGMTRNVGNLDEEDSPDFFLYVPQSFLTSTGHLNVKIKMCFKYR